MDTTAVYDHRLDEGGAPNVHLGSSLQRAPSEPQQGLTGGSPTPGPTGRKGFPPLAGSPTVQLPCAAPRPLPTGPQSVNWLSSQLRVLQQVPPGTYYHAD